MAKITAPLHSIGASGSIGKSVTFRHTANGAVATRFPKIARTQTTGQITQREKYADGITHWNATTTEQKSYWRQQGTLQQITGFNAYIQSWLNGTIAPSGIQWDGGTSIWDSGSTIWNT